MHCVAALHPANWLWWNLLPYFLHAIDAIILAITFSGWAFGLLIWLKHRRPRDNASRFPVEIREPASA